MILELFGLPATGKTTIAKALEHNGQWQYVKIKNIGELLFFNILFCFKHPLTALKIFNHTSSYQRFFNFFLYRNAKYEKAQYYQKAVIDEGLFQNLLSVFEKNATEEKMLALAKCLPKPDLLIIVETSKEEREKRSAARGTTTRGDRDYFYDEFLKILPELGLKYLKIDAAKSEEAAAAIKNYVAIH